MKTVILLLTTMLSITAYAQVTEDHDLVKDGQPVPGMTTQEEKRRSESSSYENYDQRINENRREIKRTEVPAPLENTLRDEQFTGWENGTLYQNTDDGNYSLQMDSTRHFRFDSNGQIINNNANDDHTIKNKLNNNYDDNSLQTSPVDKNTVDNNTVNENTIDN